MSTKRIHDNHNIARSLPEQARQRPDQCAVSTGAGRDGKGRVIYEQMSFADLDRDSDAYAWGLSGYGIGQGDKVLLLVPAGLPLIRLTFALFKIGCIPILIDPAMGRQNLAQCIRECAPNAMIGVPQAQAARLLFRDAFRSVRKVVTVGPLALGGVTLASLRVPLQTPYPLATVAANDPAAILFTTGSTGVPKGVLYDHGMFNAQVATLQSFYHVEPGEIDMPGFPLFALFNVAMGVTSAIPPIDPTRPASCDPAEVVEAIRDQKPTMSFGSPAIWNRVGAYCEREDITLPSLRRVLMAGAPVPLRIHQQFQALLPNGDTFTPYGATEALPVASISGREVIAAAADRPPTAGTCVGRAVDGVTLRIIGISDAPIAQWDDALTLPPNEVGEIVVRGPSVTKTYVNRTESTALAKIPDGDAVWHRMGDLGYLDDEGRLWFYGRKSHRVELADGTCLYTEPCEMVFNQHAQVFRSALVGVQRAGVTVPVMVIEPQPGSMPRDPVEHGRFCDELFGLAEPYPETAPIRTILFHASFPVDIRHNAKIFREKLAVWAEGELKRRKE